MTTEMTQFERLIQDHKIQAGIALAVAMNVIHYSGDEALHGNILWHVDDIIEVLKNKDRVLISDPDGVLCCEGKVCTSTLRAVSRVAYIGAVVILAANAIDIQRQLRAAPETPVPKSIDRSMEIPF